MLSLSFESGAKYAATRWFCSLDVYEAIQFRDMCAEISLLSELNQKAATLMFHGLEFFAHGK